MCDSTTFSKDNIIKERISKSICKIEYIYEKEKVNGTGFLVRLPIPDSTDHIRGLITSNHIINTNNAYNTSISLNFIFDEKIMYLIPKEHFCFSDPFIDITFIELKNIEYNGFEFINIEENVDIPKYCYIITNLKNIHTSKGKISKLWGFKLFHTISIEDNYLGSPLISLDDNKVIGIHLNNKFEDEEHNIYSFATSMKASIQAIRILYNSYIHSKSAFIQKEDGYIQKERKLLTISEFTELDLHGLKPSSIPEMFISPSSFFVTPLWFYRTHYAWYWTPIFPKDNCVEKSNWIIIYPGCSLKVIGSIYNGCEPAQKNITLIHWLESTGLDYLV